MSELINVGGPVIEPAKWSEYFWKRFLILSKNPSWVSNPYLVHYGQMSCKHHILDMIKDHCT